MRRREITAEQYGRLCSLIEAIWLKRRCRDYYDIDLENLPPLTSPQARRIATFIVETIEAPDAETADGEPIH